MTVLEILLERTGCADELDGALRPQSWAQLMEAIAAGTIDEEHIPELTASCIELANNYCAPPWDNAVVNAMCELDGDVTTAAAQTLIACGRAADAAYARAGAAEKGAANAGKPGGSAGSFPRRWAS